MAEGEVQNDQPTSGTQLTDEQLAEAFPGQDVAHIRAMVNKANGLGVAVSPNADGGVTNDANKNQQQGGDDGTAVSGGEGDADETVQYPDWIPEKFRQGTVEEASQKMAEAYAVLEKARGGTPPADGNTGTGSADGGDGEGTGDDSAGDKSFDLTALEAAYAKDGKLSEADYEAAAKAGMSKDVVNAYLAGQRALADQLVSRVHALAGGAETYNTMLQWAVGNWAKADVEAFDATIATGSEANINLAVRGLKAAYTEAVGQTGRRVNGDTGDHSLVEGFRSKAEMVKAIQDPRYKTDPAYRAEVAQKIHKGKVW